MFCIVRMLCNIHIGKKQIVRVMGVTYKEQERVHEMHSSGQLDMVSYLLDAFLELS